MRTDKHTTSMVISPGQARRTINNPYFSDLHMVDARTFEVKFRRKWVSCKQPNQIGLFVYSYAKMFLLDMYYNFLDRFLPRGSWQGLITDTDSIYISQGETTLRECVKPELLNEFDDTLPSVMPVDLCPAHYRQRQEKRKRDESDDSVEPEECCERHLKYQKRTLGLWKVETSADAIVALAPKSYICYNLLENHEGCDAPDTTETVMKISCKGVQKKINPLTARDYQKILQNSGSHYIVNRGLRLDHKKKMRTYSQHKRGLSYLYTKRKVLEDGISTAPLDL